MSIRIVKDEILDGCRLWQDQNGVHDIRVIRFDGIEGGIHERRYKVLDSDLCPKYGEEHPYIALLPVENILIEPDGGPSQAKATITYGISSQGTLPPPHAPAPAQLEIVTGLNSVQTVLAADGSPLEVHHTFKEIPEGLPAAMIKRGTRTMGGVITDVVGSGPGEVEFTVSQVVAVDIGWPYTVLRFTRRETVTAIQLIEWAQVFAGRINTDEYLGASPGRLLCTRFDGVTNDGGMTYVVTIELAYRKGPRFKEPGGDIVHVGWDEVIAFIDIGSDKPLAKPALGSVVAGEPIEARWAVRPEVPFSPMNLL